MGVSITSAANSRRRDMVSRKPAENYFVMELFSQRGGVTGLPDNFPIQQ